MSERPRAPLSVISHSCVTDTGRVRSENQDAWYADRDAGLFFVADGMGGMAAGAAASQYIVKFLPGILKAALAAVTKDAERIVRDALGKAVTEFSAGLRDRARAEPALKGMGSTLVLALVRGRHLFIVSVGDSRAYLLKHGVLKRQTKDHSIVAVMLELGKLSVEEAAKHPFRHKLSRYIGQDGQAVADIRVLQLKDEGRLLLCSDGLTGMLPDARIESVLKEEEIPEGACRRLVREANEAGGVDNVTALVLDLGRKG